MNEPSSTPPVVLEPLPGEALLPYVNRVAEARFCSRADLGWTTTSDVHRHRRSVDLALIAYHVGLTESEIVRLTVFEAGPAVTGRTDPGVRRTMWRAATQQRHCPQCPQEHRQSLWDLVLTLTCPEHQQLLVPSGWNDPLPRIHAGDRLHAHDADVAAAVEGCDDQKVRARLRRAHRVARLASYTADSTWPPTWSEYLKDARTHTGWDPAQQTWTPTQTPDHPVLIATLVTAAWEATASRRTTRDLVGQAWQRIDRHGLELPAHIRKHLPRRPQAPTRRRRPRPVEGSGSEPQVLADLLQHLGIEPRHFPFLMHPDQGFIPQAHEIPRAHDLARVVLHICDPENTMRFPPKDRLRIGPTINDGPLRHLQHSGQISDEALEDLQPLVEGLAADKVDYHRRRQALSTLRSVSPKHLPGMGALWSRHEQELAAGWIWVDQTRGPLNRALHPYRTPDVATFDHELQPEQRLALHEHGNELVDRNEQLIQATHPDCAALAQPAEGKAG